MKLYYTLLLLREYSGGRISNETSIHATCEGALSRATDCLLNGTSDGYAIIEDHKDEWKVINEYGLEGYTITLRNGIHRIERAQVLTLV